MTTTDRLHNWADIAWAGRPRWDHYLWAGAGVVIFIALGAPLWYVLTATAIVLIGAPWLDIGLTWLLYYRRGRG